MAESADKQLSALPTGCATGSDRDIENARLSSPRHNRWEVAALVGILILAALLRFWRLDQQEYGNGYYAAAVRSMLTSPGNFFFNAFDPTGLVTVDKPPGALWVQALSAKLFGYQGLSLLAPQALMGVLTVGLLYWQIRRLFGIPEALIAALVLAINPISIAVDRDNLPDTLLTLLLTLAAGALIRSTESASGKWLFASVAIVGAAFNVKMLAAFVVLPTFYLVYLLTAPATWFRKIGQLTAATLLLVAVSLSWSTIVDATPKSSRPYVGGSQNNSALNLALGYNGLGRILGEKKPLQNVPGPSQTQEANPPNSAGSVATSPIGDTVSESTSVQKTGALERVSSPFGGPPRLFRFAGATLAEQITWLFPLAFFGTFAALLSTGWQRPTNVRMNATLLWAGWLLTHLVVFSFAKGVFHAYYTVVMGPAVAALVGIGLPALWQAFTQGGWRRVLLPTALLATAAWQAILIGRHHVELRYWLLPIVCGGIVLGIAFLFSSELLQRIWPRIAWKRCGIAFGFGAALIGPALWSLSTTMKVASSVCPAANAAWLTGNENLIFMAPPDIDRSGERALPLVAYLRSQRNGDQYFLAALECTQVQSVIVRTGETAVSIGGFMGGDAVFTKEQFVDLVLQGKLRFMLLGGPVPGLGTSFGPGGNSPPQNKNQTGRGNAEIVAWVKQYGARVDRTLWEPATPSHDSQNAPPPARKLDDEETPLELYDLGDAALRLAHHTNGDTNATNGN